jgi:hypothetical protein
VVSGLDDNEVGPDYDDNSTSYYVGVTLATPVTGLRLGAAFDYLHVHNFSSVSTSGHPGNAWSVAGYVSYQATEKLSLHGRAEYLDDRADFFNFASGEVDAFDAASGFRVFELTGTIQYDLWKNVLTRVECRWDHGTNGKFFGSTDGVSGDQRNAVELIANVVYKF